MPSYIEKILASCMNVKNKLTECTGYPLILDAIYKNDQKMAQESFAILIDGHKTRCKKRYRWGHNYAAFYNKPDETFFVWGVGLANLCRYYGLAVVSDDPIVPAELLIPVMNNRLDYSDNIAAFEDVKKI